MSIISTLLLVSPIDATKDNVPVLYFDEYEKFRLLKYDVPQIIYPFEFIERDFPNIANKLKEIMCKKGKVIVYKYEPFCLVYSNADSAYYIYDGIKPDIIMEIDRDILEDPKWEENRITVPIYNVVYKSELEDRERKGENFEIITCQEKEKNKES